MKKGCYIVLTYNNTSDTIETLNGILGQSIAKQMDIIVVDNASDETYKNIVKVYCDKHAVTYIYRNRNDGYAGGNNYAWNKFKDDYDYMFIVNNDIVFESDKISETMMNILDKHPEIGILGPAVKTGQEEMAADSLIYKLFFGKRIFGKRYRYTKEFHERYAVAGCFLAVNLKAVEADYLFNRSFFMYAEELELCLRIWKSGFRAAQLNDSSLCVYHKGGKDPFEKGGTWKFYLASRNLVLCAKELEYADKRMFLLCLFLSVLKRVLFGPGSMSERWNSFSGYIKGICFLVQKSGAKPVFRDAWMQANVSKSSTRKFRRIHDKNEKRKTAG